MNASMKVEIGDLALHVNNQLDARPVAEIDPTGTLIRLDIFGKPSDWVPMENYTFSRPR